MAEMLREARKALGKLWAGIREATEDSAYERYLSHHTQKHAQEGPPLSRAEFYRQRMDAKFSGKSGPARCC
ncbi:MAG: YbdD/YjiX family protein [Terriglobia bacterium]